MIVTIRTQSDADFSRALVYAQAVAAWDAATFYPTAAQVSHLGRVWDAASDNSNVEPGSDATWTLGTAPPVDLTGCTLLFAARAPVGADYAPINLSSEGNAGIEITDAETGAFTLSIAQSLLAKMNPGQYVHSLICLQPSGARELIWHGTLTHEIGPTR
jgi:hypothetical protein